MTDLLHIIHPKNVAAFFGKELQYPLPIVEICGGNDDALGHTIFIASGEGLDDLGPSNVLGDTALHVTVIEAALVEGGGADLGDGALLIRGDFEIVQPWTTWRPILK